MRFFGNLLPESRLVDYNKDTQVKYFTKILYYSFGNTEVPDMNKSALFALYACSVLLFTVTGCNSSPKDPTPAQKAVIAPPEATPATADPTPAPAAQEAYKRSMEEQVKKEIRK